MCVLQHKSGRFHTFARQRYQLCNLTSIRRNLSGVIGSIFIGVIYRSRIVSRFIGVSSYMCVRVCGTSACVCCVCVCVCVCVWIVMSVLDY